MAVATMAANLIAVVFTVVFTRVLGTDGYGSLAALLTLTVILLVPGAALQVAAAREGTLGRLGRGPELAATFERWTRQLLVATVAVGAVSVALREPIAALVNVEEAWAAAAVPVTGALWLLLCLQRGLLLSARAYRPVAVSVVLEAGGRVLLSLALVGLGAGVTGAFLGTPLSIALAAVVMGGLLRRRLGSPDPASPRHPLRALARDALLPIAALTLVAALQNVDVIMAKRQLADDPAGVYAAAAVAAKAVVWIAIGVGLYLLPEATRRIAEGGDPRTVLGRALAVIAAVAAPALLTFAIIPGPLLRIAFGPDYESGDAILLLLGAAFALLAVTYLCVQFLLAVGGRRFLALLAVCAVVEPVLLAGADTPVMFARVVIAVQAAAALAVLALSLLPGRRAARAIDRRG